MTCIRPSGFLYGAINPPPFISGYAVIARPGHWLVARNLAGEEFIAEQTVCGWNLHPLAAFGRIDKIQPKAIINLALPWAERQKDAALTTAQAMIEVIRVGDDPFGRTDSVGASIKTVFYRDRSIDPERTFYMWLSHWPKDYPNPEPHNQ